MYRSLPLSKLIPMLKIKKDVIIIEVKHPCPEEFAKDLKKAIIEVLQKQEVEFESSQDSQFRTRTLLELLKQLE